MSAPRICAPCLAAAHDAAETGIPWDPCDSCRAIIEASTQRLEQHSFLAELPEMKKWLARSLANNLKAGLTGDGHITPAAAMDLARHGDIPSADEYIAGRPAGTLVSPFVHSPAPWRFVNRGGRRDVIEASNGEGVCTWARWPMDSCSRGDAALVEAAPELFDLLRFFVEMAGARPVHPKVAEAMNLLARIEERARG